MGTMEKLNDLTIVRKYAQTKRERIYNTPLMRDDIKQTIISYVTDTENLFERNFLTLDEAVRRIANAACYALEA